MRKDSTTAVWLSLLPIVSVIISRGEVEDTRSVSFEHFPSDEYGESLGHDPILYIQWYLHSEYCTSHSAFLYFT